MEPLRPSDQAEKEQQVAELDAILRDSGVADSMPRFLGSVLDGASRRRPRYAEIVDVGHDYSRQDNTYLFESNGPAIALIESTFSPEVRAVSGGPRMWDDTPPYRLINLETGAGFNFYETQTDPSQSIEQRARLDNHPDPATLREIVAPLLSEIPEDDPVRILLDSSRVDQPVILPYQLHSNVMERFRMVSRLPKAIRPDLSRAMLSLMPQRLAEIVASRSESYFLDQAGRIVVEEAESGDGPTGEINMRPQGFLKLRALRAKIDENSLANVGDIKIEAADREEVASLYKLILDAGSDPNTPPDDLFFKLDPKFILNALYSPIERAIEYQSPSARRAQTLLERARLRSKQAADAFAPALARLAESAQGALGILPEMSDQQKAQLLLDKWVLAQDVQEKFSNITDEQLLRYADVLSAYKRISYAPRTPHPELRTLFERVNSYGFSDNEWVQFKAAYPYADSLKQKLRAYLEQVKQQETAADKPPVSTSALPSATNSAQLPQPAKKPPEGGWDDLDSDVFAGF